MLINFICMHACTCRSLGVDHSCVLSCTLDRWTSSQVDFMEEQGNEKVNFFLEFCVPKNIEVPCLSYTDRDTREKYINAKYVIKLFCRSEGRTQRPPERVVRKLSLKSSPPSARKTSMVEYIGIVHVHVIECRNLVIKDITTSDPYCILMIGAQSNKTKTVYKSLAPIYNEHFTFSWDGCDTLLIDVFDKDKFTEDDHMGKLEVDMSPLLAKPDVVMEDWFQIVHRKKELKFQGEISLKLSFMKIE